MTLHIICERDVGLFSLIQQVIANVPWALHEKRIPVAYFRSGTCYWTPDGYHDRDTVWEYYFEPLVAAYPAACIPPSVRSVIAARHPPPLEVGYWADDGAFVSNHFGDHPDLKGKALWIPYLIEDPDDSLRREASAIISQFIRPRSYIHQRADAFYRDTMEGRDVIGVHIRGTDAVSKEEIRWHRRGSLQLPAYAAEVRRLLNDHPDARIFVATDAESSLDFMRDAFGNRVITTDSIRHVTGDAAGKGPTGWIMPAYIADDRQRAATNGEEAVIDYLLLARCRYLVHNGSSLARTVLLKDPAMPHTNTHRGLAVTAPDGNAAATPTGPPGAQISSQGYGQPA